MNISVSITADSLTPLVTAAKPFFFVWLGIEVVLTLAALGFIGYVAYTIFKGR